MEEMDFLRRIGTFTHGYEFSLYIGRNGDRGRNGKACAGRSMHEFEHGSLSVDCPTNNMRKEVLISPIFFVN